MSATATTAFKSPPHTHTHSHSHSKSQSHSHSHSHSRSSCVSTTPRAQPSVASAGQSMPPPLPTPGINPFSTQQSKDPKSPSPSYFGFVVGTEDSIPPDSNPGNHARQNWSFPNNASHTPLTNSRYVAVESNPEFEAFRRQSEHNHTFTLNSSTSSLARPAQSRTPSTSSNINSPVSPLSKRPMLERSKPTKDGSLLQGNKMGEASFFDIPRRLSPAGISHPHSVADHQHARLSLPMSGTLTPPSLNLNRQTTRADTLPPSNERDSSPIVSPTRILELLRNNADDTLVLDLRVYQQFAAARVQGALNLCIPTTLLKRPAYNVQRLADTFSSDYDREIFSKWEHCSHIVVYDANSSLAKEAVTPLNVLKKFTTEGWKGTGLVIKGGFLAFSKLAPEFVDSGPVQSGKGSSTQPLSISASGKDTLAVAGGCAMPAEKSAANPFFSNIRQNTDLLDGVGQMPIKKPNGMSQSAEGHLPKWLQQASAKNDEGKAVSEKFLKIEKHEQKRMQDALSVQISYGTPRPDRATQIQVAGIEKGSKNRYNNIFPYDHTRVKLQDVPQGSCDYINANHVKAQFSNRQYIATQAPIPATFNDFWRVVWEQDVRVVVMLTAESEGGQVKSHKYWTPGEYGPFKLKELSERQVSLEPKKASSKAQHASANASARPSLGARRSTTASVSIGQGPSDVKSATSKPSNITIRHLALSHSSYPFQPMREIAQIQYADWPDFGAPASPSELLALIEQVNKCIRASSPSERSSNEIAPEGRRPVLVHCSAGCGRTGTFCTIDSVIDMLKRQRLSRGDGGNDRMDIDGGDDWVSRDDVDLVAKTVDDFRHQRLSMVQNLKQFVLCYESVLQWFVGQEGSSPSEKLKRPGIQDSRRSYQG
ncbi:uncharacterized protein A1O9_04050 [Exophiala aquamarina CBS 119918]|uniref:protein-tyrosine-phosphatase n=1 Tax=Exophiala aquamarina CBS 119918 TaxID=1182545 RepID=A0A072PH77_9EURO|nr:uncharacterized protein A1O9_04050 [Exophiala aquamarina CBS 119918]KEF59206.1 hypothetical protein A1O9_04050 [Exophiala aquamarina CBS 119918]